MLKINNNLKRTLIAALIAVILAALIPYQSNAYAATNDPAVAKKSYSLYTKSSAKVISFKNLASDAVVSYKSSDNSVAVIKNGKIVPKGEGTATITASIKQAGKVYSSNFKVVISPSSVKFKTEPVTSMFVGDTQKLKLKGIGVTVKKVKFSSSDKTVATVTSSGTVKAKKAGIVTITATETSSKLKTSVTINVFDKEKTYKIPSKSEFLESLNNIPHFELNGKVEETNLCKSAAEVNTYILKKITSFKGFNVVVKDLSYLISPEEYLSKYPSIASFSYESITKYNNAYVVNVKAEKECSFYSDEYIIDVVLSNGDVSLLDQNQYATYSSVVGSANNLKGDTELETVRNIHDALVVNYVYKNSGTDNSHKLSYALSKHECVCDGYAKSFYFICRAAGLDVIMVLGDAISASGSEAHSWNKVKINGKWYSIDVTWDDPVPDKPGEIQTNYYLLTDADIARNHVWDNTGLPSAVSDDLGPIYSKIAGIKQVNGLTEFKKEINSMLSSAADEINAAGSKSITMKIIENSGNSSCWQELQSVLSDYNKNKRFGYKAHSESAGIFGSLFEFTLYR